MQIQNEDWAQAPSGLFTPKWLVPKFISVTEPEANGLWIRNKYRLVKENPVLENFYWNPETWIIPNPIAQDLGYFFSGLTTTIEVGVSPFLPEPAKYTITLPDNINIGDNI